MQNSKLTFHLTGEDIADARRYGFESELLYLLARRTGTLWSLNGPSTAQELVAPHRGARFFMEVAGAWQNYQGEATENRSVRVDVGPLETLNAALDELEIPQDSIANLAMRFFENRSAETPRRASIFLH